MQRRVPVESLVSRRYVERPAVVHEVPVCPDVVRAHARGQVAVTAVPNVVEQTCSVAWSGQHHAHWRHLGWVLRVVQEDGAVGVERHQKSHRRDESLQIRRHLVQPLLVEVFVLVLRHRDFHLAVSHLGLLGQQIALPLRTHVDPQGAQVGHGVTMEPGFSAQREGVARGALNPPICSAAAIQLPVGVVDGIIDLRRTRLVAPAPLGFLLGHQRREQDHVVLDPRRALFEGEGLQLCCQQRVHACGSRCGAQPRRLRGGGEPDHLAAAPPGS
mmetsp:Transcript_18345/g.49630  ORF Transcript_18345/g.49630 Transcript_18345/m.49630 type:complete len:272 (-) Transcript_18345:130-945(-)